MHMSGIVYFLFGEVNKAHTGRVYREDWVRYLFCRHLGAAGEVWLQHGSVFTEHNNFMSLRHAFPSVFYSLRQLPAGRCFRIRHDCPLLCAVGGCLTIINFLCPPSAPQTILLHRSILQPLLLNAAIILITFHRHKKNLIWQMRFWYKI